MKEYEFSQTESKHIGSWATQMRIFGILNIFLGVVILAVVLPSSGGFGVAFVARLLNGITSLVLGVVLLRPVDNLRRVVKTEGGDIAELMTGLTELFGGFKLVVFLSIFYLVVLLFEVVAILVGL